MLNDAQRAVLADIKLPKPLQDMLDENVYDNRLPEYYETSLPGRDRLIEPINELRTRLDSDLQTIVKEPDPIARKRLLLGVAATLEQGQAQVIDAQASLLEPFVNMEVFLQLTTAMDERTRLAVTTIVAATKDTTSTVMNDHLAAARNDAERKITRIEKKIRRQLFARKVKRLFGITP